MSTSGINQKTHTETRIPVADSHRIVREGICSLLQNEDHIQIIGQANNGRTTIKLAPELHPDVIIMKISMPNLNGIEATRKIVHQRPGIKSIAELVKDAISEGLIRVSPV